MAKVISQLKRIKKIIILNFKKSFTSLDSLREKKKTLSNFAFNFIEKIFFHRKLNKFLKKIILKKISASLQT
jgi:hypothetical protein